MNKCMNEVRLLAMMLLVTGGMANAAPVYQYVACTSCSARIPDATGAGDGVVTAAITVPATVCTGSMVSAYALQLDIVHSNVGDLKVNLNNPSGSTTVAVLNRPVTSADCHGDDISATFLDAGATVTCGTQIPALSGDVQSSGVLATFGSAPQPGIWLVDVHDQAAGDDGFLRNAQLRMTCAYTDGIFTDSFEIP
jgi:subtilisin-like proprotein convertase family protein